MRDDIRAMQAMVDTMVGIEKFSYPAKQNAPRKEQEFAAISLTSERPVGVPIVKNVWSEEAQQYREVTATLMKLLFRVSLKFTDGVASAKIQSGWTTTAMVKLMKELGYGFIGCAPTSLEDAKLEHIEWEPRQGLTVAMYHTRVFAGPYYDKISGIHIDGRYVENGLEKVLDRITINEDE